MKSGKHKGIKGVRFGDILQSFTTNQLAWIGAVVMVFNEAEAKLHLVFGACIRYHGDPFQISSRFRGTEGLISVIKDALPRLGLTDEIIQTIDLTLTGEGFTQVRSYRGGVIHANLVDMSSGLSRAPGKDGKRDAVLLSEEALEGLHERIAIITKELEQIHTIVSCSSRLIFGSVANDQHKARLEESVQAASARCVQHQNQRQSLPPLPVFPEAPDIYELEPNAMEPERSPPGRKPRKAARKKDI